MPKYNTHMYKAQTTQHQSTSVCAYNNDNMWEICLKQDKQNVTQITHF